jgi:hypothetical protein
MQFLKDTAHAPEPTTRPRLVWLAALLVAGSLAVSACGPVQSTSRIQEAEVAFERARVVEAHEMAPYEYYSAKYYLHKSKEEWGYSDFEASVDYARRARQAAEAARLKAQEDPWSGSPVKDRKDGQDTSAEAEPEPSGY